MRKCLLFVFSILYSGLFAQPTETYSRIKISLEYTALEDIAALGLETEHGQYAPGRYLINDFEKQEIALLEEAGIPFEVLAEDASRWYVERNREEVEQRGGNTCPEETDGYDYPTPANYEYGSMGGYYTYEEMLDILARMAELYPRLITPVQPIGDFQTHEGRPIYWLRLSDNPETDEDEPELLYTALHHAREPNSLSQMIFYLWHLLENYETDAEVRYLVDNTEMYFIPCVNPDGYIYNQTTNPNGGGLWRKNRRDNGDGTFGVDLNRNYGFHWGEDNQGSSPNTNSQVYRGPEPFSEPETQAVKYFCENHQFQLALNYHTYGNLLVHPWGFNDTPTEEDDIFKGMGGVMTQENNFTLGTGTETVGYVVNGDSDDWMYGEEETKNAIYSMTPEVGPGFFGFWPPQSAIDQLNKSCLLQNLKTANLVLNYAEVEGQSGGLLATQEGEIRLMVKKYGLMEGPLTLSLSAGSDNVTAEASPQTYTLAQLEEAPYSFRYTLDEHITDGEEVLFVLQLDNGTFVQTDTLRKQALRGIPQTVFSDGLETANNWATAGQWSITESDFISAPSSYTDSPGGNYANGTRNLLLLRNPISLADDNGQRAFLRFWARWEIESGWDYVQLLLSTNRVIYKPLCGKYTKTATGNFQPEGEPVYDGVQEEWVQEEIEITEYLGEEEIFLRFDLVSDGFFSMDGFYFDDMKVVTYAEEELTKLPEPGTGLAYFHALPNPFRQQISAEFALSSPRERVVARLLNPFGQTIAEEWLPEVQPGVPRRISFSTDRLSPGIFFLQLWSEEQLLDVRKVVKTE